LKCALNAPFHGLDNGVLSAAVAHVLEGKEWFCSEIGSLPRDEFFAARFCRKTLVRAELRWNCCWSLTQKIERYDENLNTREGP